MSKLSQAAAKWRLAAIIIFNKLMGFLSRIVPRKKMTITIEQGTLQGLHFKTQIFNKPYASFLGIPYAKAPINDLRFKPPVKHPGWSGILKAYSEGNMCMQYDVFVTKKIVGSEDCLYLNVYVPQEDVIEKKSVMVFIHGGAFSFGSGSSDFYSPDYLLNENVIVVTINYRVNILGFLNLGVDECPGNMGLKDQLFAFKWVKANISAFGGDADNITIFGESAGAASVHYHTLSPLSKGSFQKAIMQSGCSLNPWAFNENHREAASQLAKNLGCQENDPKKIVQYLQNVPASDLVKYTPMKSKCEGQRDLVNYQFVPSVESDAVRNRFLPAHPEVLIKTASPVPLIYGINSMEGMIVLADHKLGKNFDFNKNEEIRRLFDSQYNEEIIDKIRKFYFNGQNSENETVKLENTCHLFSDVFFAKDFYRSFDDLVKRGDSPVYNYEFKFCGDINIIKQLLFITKPKYLALEGTCHADELNYLFFTKLFGFLPKADSAELRMCRTMSKFWSNFAKNGNPNSSDLEFTWNKTSADEPKYLSIDGDNTRMVDGLLNSSRTQFWEKISQISSLKQKL